jgi:hypothetical protein
VIIEQLIALKISAMVTRLIVMINHHYYRFIELIKIKGIHIEDIDNRSIASDGYLGI